MLHSGPLIYISTTVGVRVPVPVRDAENLLNPKPVLIKNCFLINRESNMMLVTFWGLNSFTERI